MLTVAHREQQLASACQACLRSPYDLPFDRPLLLRWRRANLAVARIVVAAALRIASPFAT